MLGGVFLMERVVKLLFELSSEERMNMLLQLSDGSQRPASLAKKLNITTSETARHIGRLLKNGIISKEINGEYNLTNLGQLIVRILPYFESLIHLDSFIQQHDFTVIPTQFLLQLGELRESIIFSGFYGVMDTQETSVEDSNQRIWIMSPEVLRTMAPLIDEKITKGVDVRIILPKDAIDIPTYKYDPDDTNIRYLDEIPLMVAVLDDRGGVCLPDRTGKVDLSEMLAGANPKTYNWLSNLFLYYWNLG